MDLLFWQYVQTASNDNEKIRGLFTQLRELCQLPQNQFDEVFYVVSDLCLEHGSMAFAEGIRYGYALARDLSRIFLFGV